VPTLSMQSPSSSFTSFPPSVTPTMSYQSQTVPGMLSPAMSVSSFPGSSLLSSQVGVGHLSRGSSPRLSLTQAPLPTTQFSSLTNAPSTVSCIPSTSSAKSYLNGTSASSLTSVQHQPLAPAGISAEEYAGYVAQFATLDAVGDGFLSGKDARVVLSQSVGPLPGTPLPPLPSLRLARMSLMCGAAVLGAVSGVRDAGVSRRRCCAGPRAGARRSDAATTANAAYGPPICPWPAAFSAARALLCPPAQPRSRPSAARRRVMVRLERHCLGSRHCVGPLPTPATRVPDASGAGHRATHRAGQGLPEASHWKTRGATTRGCAAPRVVQRSDRHALLVRPTRAQTSRPHPPVAPTDTRSNRVSCKGLSGGRGRWSHRRGRRGRGRDCRRGTCGPSGRWRTGRATGASTRTNSPWPRPSSAAASPAPPSPPPSPRISYRRPAPPGRRRAA
jgi:hypothetical protein